MGSNWSGTRHIARNIGVTIGVFALLAASTTLYQAPTASGAITTNTCSNPVLVQNLNGWGSLDGASVSRDTVGDLRGATRAFDTAGRQFFQPQLSVAPGQRWTVSAEDRVLNASGTSEMVADWYSGSGAYLGESAGSAVALPASSLSGGTWTLVSATFTAPADATSAHILQDANFGSATGTAFKATECDYELAHTSPSGIAMPVGDLSADSQGPQGWRQTFSDDFTTTGTATSSGSLPDVGGHEKLPVGGHETAHQWP